MGLFQQFFLVLGKNFTLLSRQPLTFSAVIIWPLTIAVLLAVLRQGLPPVSKQECDYPPRSVPSAGILPFMQSTVCTINNKCENGPTGAEAEQARRRMSALMSDISPLVKSKYNLGVLKELPDSVKTIKKVNDVLQNDNITAVLGADLRIKHFFKNVSLVEHYLVNETGVLDQGSVASLMNASLNFVRILELTDGPIDFEAIICRDLSKYLVFSASNASKTVAEQLCLIDKDKIPNIVETLQKQIDIRKVMELAEKLAAAMEEYDISAAFRDSALLYDLLLDSNMADGLSKNYPVLVRLSNLIRQAGPIAQMVNDAVVMDRFNLSVIAVALRQFDPLVKAVVEDDKSWNDFKNGLDDIQHAAEIITGVFNKIPDAELTFGGMLESPQTVADFLARYVDANLISAVFATPVSTQRLQAWIIEQMTKGVSWEELLCDKELVSFMNVGNRTALEQFQMEFCRINQTLLDEELQGKLDLDYNKLFTLLQLRQRSLTQLNYTELVETVNEAIQAIGNVPETLGKVLGPLGEALPRAFEAVFQAITQTITAQLNGNMDPSSGFTQLFDQVYTVLVSTNPASVDEIDAAIYVTSGMINITVQAVYDATSEFRRLAKHEAMKKVVKAIFKLPVENIERVLMGFVDPAFLKVLSESPDDISRICNPARLSRVLGVPDVDLNDVSNTMCENLDFGNLVMAANDILSIQKVTSQIDELLKRKVPSDQAILRTAFLEVMSTVLVDNTRTATESAWIQTFLEANVVANGTSMQMFVALASGMTEGVRTARFFHVATEAAPRVETKYPEIRSFVLSGEAALKKQLAIMQTTYFQFSPFLELEQYIPHIPVIMEAMLKAMLDPKKSGPLMEILVNPERFCGKDNLRYYLDVPGDVPIDTIRGLLCQINVTEIMHRYAEMYDWTSVVQLIQMHFQNATPPPIQWPELFDLVMSFVQYTDPLSTGPGKLIAQLVSVGPVIERVMQTAWPNDDEAGQVVSNIIQQGMGQAYGQLWGAMVSSGLIDYEGIVYNNITDLVMVEITERLIKMQANGLRFDILFEGQMEDVKALLSVTPDLVKTLLDNVYNSAELSQKLSKIGTCPILDCHWLRDLLPSADPALVATLEKMIANEGKDTIQELMQEPIVQKINQMIETLNPGVPDTVTFDPLVYLAHSIASSNFLMALTLDPNNPVFPDLPGFDMSKVEKAIENISRQNMSWEQVGLQQSMAGLEQAVAQLGQQNDPFLHLALRSMTTLIQLVNMQLTVNEDSSSAYMWILYSEELTKLTALVGNQTDLLKAVTDSVLYWVTRPSQFLAELAQPFNSQKLCSSDEEFARFFRADSAAIMQQLKVKVCAEIDVSKLARELEGHFGWLHEVWSMIHDQTATSNEKFDPLELSAAIRNLTTTLVTSDVQLPPFWSGTDFGKRGILDGIDDFMSQYTLGTIRMLLMDGGSAMGSFLETQPELSEMMNPVLHSVMTVLTGAAKTVSEWKGVNYEPVIYYANYPDLMKVFAAIDNGSLLMEVFIRTGISNQAELNIMLQTEQGIASLCQNPQLVFDIPGGKEATFVSIFQELCTVNLTKLNPENLEANHMTGLLTDVLDKSPVNMTALAEAAETFITVMTKVSGDATFMQMLQGEMKEFEQAFERILKFNNEFYQDVDRVSAAQLGNLAYVDLLVASLDQTDPLISNMVAFWTVQAEVSKSLDQRLRPLIGQNVTFQNLTKGYTELTKVVNLVDVYPDLILLVTKSVTAQTSKWAMHLPTMTPASFCGGQGRELLQPVQVVSDVSQILADICQIDFVKLQTEVMTFTGINITAAYEQAMKNPSLTPMRNLINAQLAIQTTLTSLITTSDFSDVLQAVMRHFQQDGFADLLKNISNPMQILSMSEPLMRLTLPQLVSGMDEATLVADMIIREHITEAAKAIGFKNQTFHELVDTLMPKARYPTLNSMMRIADYTLPLVAIIITSSQKDPVQWNNLMSNPMVFCNASVDAMSMLPVSADLKTNGREFLAIVCAVDGEKFTQEAANFIGLTEYHRLLEDGLPLNHTRYVNSVLDTASLQLQLQNMEPNAPATVIRGLDMIDVQKWMDLLKTFEQATQAYSDVQSALTSVGNSIGGLLTLPFIQENLGYIHAFEYILDQVIGRTQYLNRSGAAPSQMFPDAPEMQKMMDMLPHSPEIAQVLMVTYDTPKFQALLNPPNVTQTFIKICHPFSNISEYFNVPAKSGIDLDKLKTEFCQINITTLMGEFDQVFGTKALEEKLQNVDPANSTRILLKAALTLNQLMTILNDKETTWLHNDTWLNPEVWMGVIQKYLEMNAGDEAIKEAGAIFMTLLPVFENDTSAQTVGRIMYTVMDNLIRNKILTDATWSPEKMMRDIPQLRALYYAVANLTSVAAQEFKNKFLREPIGLLSVVMAQNPEQALCMFSKDPELKQILCSFNATLLSEQLDEYLSVTTLIGQVTVAASQNGPFDWVSFLQKTNEFVATIMSNNFTNAITPPSGIDQETFKDATNVIASIGKEIEQNNAKAFGPLIQTVLNALNSTALNQQVEMQVLYMELYVTVMQKVGLDQGEVNLRNLVKDTTEAKKLMDALMAQDPTMMETWLNMVVRLDQLPSMILNLMRNAEFGLSVICDPATLQKYFVVEAVAAGRIASVCQTNMTIAAGEFMNQIGLDKIIETTMLPVDRFQTANVTALLLAYDHYMNLLNQLNNVSAPQYGQYLLQSYLNVSVDMKQTLDGWVKNLPELGAKTIGKAMDELMPVLLNGSEFWNSLKPSLVAVNMVAKTLAGKMQQVPLNNVTLEAFMTDSVLFRRLLVDSINAPPELIEMIMNSPVNNTKVMNLNMSDPVGDFICHGGLMYKPGGAVDDMLSILCDMKQAEMVLGQLAAEFTVPQIIQKINQLTPATPFNWTETVENLASVYVTSSQLATAILNQMPDLFTFLGSEKRTDMWLQQMMAVLQGQWQEGQEVQAILNIIGDALLNVGPVLGDDFRMVALSVNTALKAFHRKLQHLSNRPITFESILHNATQTRAILDSMKGLNPNVVDYVMKSLVNVTEVERLMRTGQLQNPAQTLCQVDMTVLLFPYTSDMFGNAISTAEMTTFFCQLAKEWDTIGMELLKQFDGDKISQIVASHPSQLPQTDIKTLFMSSVDEIMKSYALLMKMDLLNVEFDQDLMSLFDFRSWMDVFTGRIAQLEVYKTVLDAQRSAVMLLGEIYRGEPDWRHVIDNMELQTVFTSYVGNMLDKLTDDSQTLTLANLFPDVKKVEEMILAAVGPGAPLQLMMLQVNPEKYFQLVQSPDYERVMCSRSEFDQYFRMPSADSVNATYVQSTLCEAARTGGNLMADVMQMMDVNSLLVEVSRVEKSALKTKNDQQIINNYFKFYKLLPGQIDIVERLKEDPTEMSAWMNMFEELGARVGEESAKSCELMNVYYLEQMPVWTTMQAGMEVTMEMMKQMPKYVSFLERMSKMTVNDYITFIQELEIPKMTEKFQQMMSGKQKFDCVAMVGKLNQALPEMIEMMPKYIKRASDALEKMKFEDMAFIEFIKMSSSLSQDMVSLMSDERFQEMVRELKLPEVMMNMVAAMQSTWTAATPAYVKLTDILVNATSFEELLTQSSAVLPELVDEVMAASFGIDLKMLTNISYDEVSKMACDQSALQAWIKLPANSLLTIQMLSEQLCNLERSGQLKGVLDSVDLAKLFLELSKKTTQSPYAWLDSLANDFTNIVEDFEAVLKLVKLVSGLDLQTLVQILPEIQEFVRTDKPEQLFESITSFVNNLRQLSPRDPTLNQLIDDMIVIVRSMKAMEYFQRLFPFTVSLRDLVKRPDELLDYLINDVNMTDRAAMELLNSTFSYVQLMNMTRVDIENEICNSTKLEKLLVSQETIDVSAISRQLCVLSKEHVADILDRIILELDVGDFIKDVVTLGIEDIMKTKNISLDKVKNTIEKFEPLEPVFTKSVQKIKEIGDKMKYKLPTPDAQTSPLTETEALAQAVCGDRAALDFDDVFSVSSAFSGSGQISGTRGEDQYSQSMLNELDTIQGDPCKDLYRSVHSTQAGSIVWSYLKPLIMGRVLYAPSTPLTDQIMNEAGGIFGDLDNFMSMLESLTSTSKEVKALGDDFVDKFKEALDSPMLAQAFGSSGDLSRDQLLGSLEMLSMLGSEEVQNVIKYSERALNYSQCMEKQRFEGVTDEQTMEAEARRLADDKRLIAGVVFVNLDGDGSGTTRKKRSLGNSTLPKNVKYKIRLDIDNTPDVENLFVGQWDTGPKDSFANDMRYLRGFLPLQDMIDRAIISAQIGEKFEGPAVETNQFPFPCHRDDNFLKYTNAYILPLTMMFCWMVFVSIGVKTLVAERESGIDETLRIMGLRGSVSFLAWFVSIFVPMLVVGALFTIILWLGGLLPYSDPLIIFLFIVVFSLSVVMLSYMVSAFFTTTNLAALVAIIIYLICYMPFAIIEAQQIEEKMAFWHKMIAMIPMSSAFSFGAQYITRFEAAGVGLQWSNLNEGLYHMPGSFMWCAVMMLVDSVAYFIIGWYFRNVMPGKFGLSQPWYFPVSPRYWGCTCCYRANKGKYYEANVSYTNQAFDGTGDAKEKKGVDSSFAHEANIEGRQPGVRLRNLTKRFGMKVAVDNLTADFYRGDVTAFLGRNGAGKTTTIDMLIGMKPPSKGTAFVEDYDVRKDWIKIRRNIGICPQYNLLYETMTVEEHLRFFAGLKSAMPKKILEAEVDNMLANIGLWHMRREKVLALSGGMKRRLAVALAFIGGSETVILDEPTSGVDPSARRQIWDLIVQYKQGRTIILTTHHLEEADVLSDRIVIINKGRIISSGSPMFLKRQFGRGYELTMSLAEPEAASEALDFVQTRLPTASPTKQSHNELRVNIPAKTQGLQPFFDELDAKSGNLNVQSYGISDTTLDEVVGSMCELSDAGQELCEENLKTLHEKQVNDERLRREDLKTTEPDDLRSGRTYRLSSGLVLIFAQVFALITKRFHHHKRFLRGIITQVVLPCVLVAFAALASTTMPGWGQKPRVLMLTPGIYALPNQHVFFKSDNSAYNTRLTSALLAAPGLGTMCLPGVHKPWITPKEYDTNSPSSYISCEKRNMTFMTPAYSAPANPGTCTCEADRQVCEEGASGPPTPRTLINPGAEIHDLRDKNISDYLLTTHSQFMDNRYGGYHFMSDPSGNSTNHTAVVWYNNRGLHSLPAFYNGLSNAMLREAVRERTNVSVAEEYGITAFNDPLQLTKGQISVETILSRAAHMGIAMLLICAVCFIPAGFVVFLVRENRHQEKRLQFVYGVRPTVYWLTQLFWDMVMYAIPVGLIILILWVCVRYLNLEVFNDQLDLAAVAALLGLYGWAVLPICYLFSRRFPDSGTAFMSVFITQLFTGCIAVIITFLLGLFYYTSPIIALVYTIIRYAFLAIPPYALGDAMVALMRNQVLSSLFSSYGEDVYVHPFTFALLGWHMVALGAVGLLFLLLTVIAEQRCSCCGGGSRRKRPETHRPWLDSDVMNEQYRISRGDSREDVVVLDGLRKVYRSGLHKVVGVDEVYMGVQKGECFGLLGENGAGKTSLFGMLTGELTPSAGKAVICGTRVQGASSAFRTCVGYCPQFDALDQNLTGREILYFYAKLKGVSSGKLVEVVDRSILDLQLSPVADKTVSTYSGGTRRRLAVAVALLADPLIVLLDEPTSGMDVQMRRLIWSTLNDVMASGRSVIVTSHRMDECEAACSRMSIMVNGNLKCLGSPQHIKSKYGSGYTISMHLASPTDADRAVQMVEKSFPDAAVKDHRHRLLEMSVPVSEPGVLGRIFGLLESHREVMGVIDYSVTQTTLDQVFLAFCRKQGDGVLDTTTSASSEAGSSTPPRSQGFTNAAYFSDAELGIVNNKDKMNTVKKPMETVDIEIPQIHFEEPHSSGEGSSGGSGGEPSPKRSPSDSPELTKDVKSSESPKSERSESPSEDSEPEATRAIALEDIEPNELATPMVEVEPDYPPDVDTEADVVTKF